MFQNVVWDKDGQDINWANRVKNQIVEEENNILPTIKRMKINWIGDILRKNCRVKHVIQ